MRKLFLLSVVICAASFIMAAITHGIWGESSSRGSGGGGNVGYTHYRDEGCVFNETVSSDKEWHINNEFTKIEVDSAAVKTLIVPTAESEMIRVCAQVPNGKNITVRADWNGDSLCIAAHPKSVSFNGIMEYGVVDWLDDIFGDSNGIVITIEIPERILESFSLKQGSGTTIVRDINAANNYIEIGSGTVNFYGSGRYAQRMFYLDIASGNACVTDMLANYYSIDIGAGKFVVSGLKGYGEIDVGSGKGSVFYSEFGGTDGRYDHQVDMGAGRLDLYLPKGASTYVNADIGAGAVNIDALGKNDKITGNNEEDVVLIGSYSDSADTLYIDIGAGSVNIYDYDNDELNKLIKEYAVEEPSLPPKSDSNTASVVEIITAPSLVESSSSVVEEKPSAVIGDVTVASGGENVPTPPEAPDTPPLPEASEVIIAPNPPEIGQTA